MLLMKTILVIHNSYLILSSEDEDLLESIYDTLSFKDTSKAYTYGGRFDPDRIVTVRFSKFVELDLSSLKVPIGFLDFIQSVLTEYRYSVVDDRKPIQEIEVDQIENLDGIELMNHQLGAIYTALSRRRGIIKSPTGSGKTEIFLAILNMLEKPSLVLFNRQQLTRQTVERSKKRGLDVGIVQGANIEEKNITMATIQSVHKIESIKKYKNLILDECFPAPTTVLTTNGSVPISKIVKRKLNIKVLSYNKEAHQYENKKITGWFKNKSKSILEIRLSNKKYTIKCTDNHKIFVNDFETKRAEQLSSNDKVIVRPIDKFANGLCATPTKMQYQAILGMVLGDSCISKTTNLARMRTTQGERQIDYLKYKIDILSSMYSSKNVRIGKSGYNSSKKTYMAATKSSIEFLELAEKFYLNKEKIVRNIISEIDEVSLAFWFMDDGHLVNGHNNNKSQLYHLATYSFSKEESELILKFLLNKYSITGKLRFDKRCKRYGLAFDVKSSEIISRLIHKYVPQCMQYKLINKFRNKFENIDYGENNFGRLKIRSITKLDRELHTYNITVEGNHNYFINQGILVSNCHNIASKQYQKILKLKHWERVYGFSATPVNPKKMDLKSAKIIANIGSVICDVGAKDLIDKGIIAKPKIFMMPVNMPDNIDDFSYREAEMVGIIYNKYRNKLIARLAEKYRSKGVLILNKYVNQGKEIQKLLPDAPFIWHETPVKERLKIVEKFDKGDIEILIASRILDEGIDIKNFEVLIIASAGLSFVKTIQRLGRGLRVTDSKKSILVYDFMDNTNYKLLKHSKTRMKTYKMFEYDDVIKVKEIDNAIV